MKVLLVIFQFRNIPQFLESVKDLTIDKLWIKFYPQREAYDIGRRWFLEHKEYSHFLLLTDDVIVLQKDIEQLIENVDYGVISGWFNQNLTDHATDTNFSFTLPPDPPFKGQYKGYQFEKIDTVDTDKIIKVLHQGTALTLLSREIVEQVPFRHSEGCCIDSCLSLDLYKKKIPQYIDLGVQTLHLKISDEMQARISEVGKQTPVTEFI